MIFQFVILKVRLRHEDRLPIEKAMTFDDAQFDDLIRRVRIGEAQAARELVLHYEPEIRREVRIWLTDPKLRRVVDSLDICQSVFGIFFVRVALGQFDLAKPQNLFRLLATMAKNKVIDKHRSETSRRATLQQATPETDYSTSGELVFPIKNGRLIKQKYSTNGFELALWHHQQR